MEAVRWKLAIEKYIVDRNYKIGTLVAFSGELNALESGPDGFTESSKLLNPNLNGRDIREAFKGDEYSILCWWPINFKPDLTSSCCAGCTWINGWQGFRQSRLCHV